MKKMVKREKKRLECGCVVERYSKKGNWWVYCLCQKHKDSYYEDPNKYLRLVNWALKDEEGE